MYYTECLLLMMFLENWQSLHCMNCVRMHVHTDTRNSHSNAFKVTHINAFRDRYTHSYKRIHARTHTSYMQTSILTYKYVIEVLPLCFTLSSDDHVSFVICCYGWVVVNMFICVECKYSSC